MNVPQETLDDLALAVVTAQAHLRALSGSALDARWEEATEHARAAESLIGLAGGVLENAGARRLTVGTGQDVPLDKLMTAANGAYYRTLVHAWNAAQAVDRERFGEEAGINGPAARAIETLLRIVEAEMQGPRGMDAPPLGA